MILSLLLLARIVSYAHQTDLPPAYQLAVSRKKENGKTEILNPDRSVTIVPYEDVFPRFSDFAGAMFTGWYPGFSHIRGHCTVVNDTVLNVGGTNTGIDQIRTIRAESPARVGERVPGGVALASVPLWTTLAIGCTILGFCYVLKKTPAHRYNLTWKWDLKVVRTSVPLDLLKD